VLGLLIISYVSWLVVSLGWMDFSRASILLGFLVVGALSALVLVTRWQETRDFLVRRWRLLLIGEGLFLVAFLAFVAIRAANPDLWHPWRGGEKPMELAYLNAVLRSTSMPPYDPWFAGGYLNYYYWGYFVLAALIKSTGIIPTTAFNLAVPLLFALTVTSAYSVVYNLAEGVRGSNLAMVYKWQSILWSPVSAGLVAALLVAVIGNLDGVVQLVQGAWYKVVDGQRFPPFDFWRSSRMLPNLENISPSALTFWVPDKIPGSPDVSWHITEFPFFTFLFADLHPHMMVIPFTLLVLGLGLSLVAGLGRPVWATGLSPLQGDSTSTPPSSPSAWKGEPVMRPWLISAAITLALALGALWVINSWDYPSYLLLTLVLIGLAVYFHPASPLRKLWLFIALASGVAVLSVLAFLPFHQAYQAFDTGIVASKWRTPIDRYLVVHGLFLFIVATFLIYHTRRTLAQVLGSLIPHQRVITDTATIARSGPMRPYALVRVALVVGLTAAIFLGITGYWTAAILLVFLVLAGLAARTSLAAGSHDMPFAIVPLILLSLGLLIGIGVDFVRLTGDIGRMNTFFKYYLEAWVLLSLAAAYMLWYLGSRLAESRHPAPTAGRSGWLKGVWLGVLTFLVVSSLIYTVLGTRARLSDRFSTGPVTLDGTAYMVEAVHQENGKPLELKWDLEAIQWLQDTVEGSPVVLEAHNEQYHWSARIASYTGLPTVLGWPWHQMQQRMDYDYAVRDRAAVVQELYNTTDRRRAEELLRQYEVKYIVMGQLEQIYYSPKGLQKFEDMAAQGLLTLDFQNQGAKIYRVHLSQRG
jgi:YYY domain-containing protein